MNQKPYLLFFVPIGLAFIILGSFINVAASSAIEKSPSIPAEVNAGFIINPTSGLTTTEAGGSATFSVVLTGQPTATVTINLNSSNTSEGSVSPVSLAFTTENWNVAQDVTVSGVNDFVTDGNIPYTIHGAASSLDLAYNALPFPDVSVTNIDNDPAGFTVIPTSRLTTNEAGGTADFSVALTSQPFANVTINLNSSNTSEGVVSSGSLTFTSANWNIPQVVTVTGVNDFVADGNIAYTINGSVNNNSDAKYIGLVFPSVTLINNDNDVVGLSISPTTGLITTEGGGTTTFSITLTSQPASNVSIDLTSSDLTEGTITPASLQFTNGNWNQAHVVTISGVDDAIVDGNIDYTINGSVISSDTNYANLPFPAVSVTNNDNDLASIKTTANPGLTTSENGAQATFTMVLGSQPTADVTISLTSSKPAEGTVSPSSLVFNSSNWNTPRTVTVTGIDDPIVDGSIAYTINGTSSSTDLNYDNKPVTSVPLVNLDNDTAGFTISPGGGLVTTESGGAGTFLVKLTSQPVADVIIAITSSDTSEGTVSPSALTYTAANWNDFQTVTVTGVDDFVADGNITYTINALSSSSDVKYNNQVLPPVSVTNQDDDIAGIYVSPTSGLVTTEGRETATFSVVLNSQPTANVSIALSSSDIGEGTVSPTPLIFTSANWNVPRIVTVTGVDDPLVDGNIAYIINGSISTTDSTYSKLSFPPVLVTNNDNDVAGIKLTLPSDLTTNESGKKVNFTVALTSQPSADVTVKLTSTDNTEGNVSPISLTFTNANWNTGQTVTITGVDDNVADGNISYNINVLASSKDSNYDNLAAPIITLTNVDNDSPGFVVNPTSGLVTSESGGKARFFVALTSQPTADVTIQWTSSITTEGTVSPAAILFNSTNWSAPMTVTVTGVDDFVIDGNIPYTITGDSTSEDPSYGRKTLPVISLINSDNDAAGITVNRTSGLYTTEAGRIISFTVTLNTKPSDIVTITMTSTNSLEGVVSPTLLTFSKTDWNQAKVVTLTGIDDQVNDGNSNYSILMALTSSDQKYNNLPAPLVSATNLDNDGPTIAWAAPIDTNVTNDLIYTFSSSQQPSLQLTISDQQNEPISKVRFYRWDFVLNQHVEIGTVTAPPFTLYLDTTTLYPGYNQIFAVAYDPEGNQSNHIWLFADRRELLFLPTIKR